MTAEPASTRANRINSDSLDWSYIAISLNGWAFDEGVAREGRALAGKRLGQSIADVAEADNCVGHDVVSQIIGVTGPSASELRKAAVNGDLAGGHEAAVRRGEKGGRRCDLGRIGHAFERSHRSEDLLALLA